jgi:hypothetical protein
MGWLTKDLDFDSRQGKRVSLLYSVETNSDTYPVTCPELCPAGINRPESEADYTTPYAEVNSAWSYTSTSTYVRDETPRKLLVS